MTNKEELHLWLCDEASQLSNPKNALWYHLTHWPDIYNMDEYHI